MGEETPAPGAEPDRELVDDAYEMLFRSNPQPAWVLDTRTFAFLDVNIAAEKLYGFQRRELLQRTIFDGLDPEDAARLVEKRDSLPAGPSRGVWKLRRSDRSQRWIEVTTQPFGKTPHRRLVIGRDVTDELATLDALKLSETRFTRLLEAGIVSVIVGEPDGRVLEANDAFLRLTGYSRADLEAGRLSRKSLTPPEWDVVSDGALSQLRTRQSAGPFEKEYFRKDGTRVPVLIASINLTPQRILSVVLDLTERQRAEDALRRSESLFRAIVEASPDGVTLMSADTTVLYWSPGAAEIAGIPASEVIGRKLIDLPVVADRAQYLREWQKCMTQPGVPLRVFLPSRHPDGRPRYVESIRVNYLDDPRLRAVVTIVRDVTERRRLEEQLQQAQKMEAVGNLAGGVAHDFNNLLTVILGYSAILLRAIDPRDPLHEHAGEIEMAARRAAELTRQLLAFSRRQVLHPIVLDLSVTLGEMEKLISRLVGDDIRVVTIKDPRLARVKADAGQIGQVIMNLVVNARDAMPKGGQLTIELRNVTIDASASAALHGTSPGRYVLLSTTDTGVGMSNDVKDRVFEPFFTTKASGTGLGLATTFGIVRQSGGVVAVESQPGRGSSFKVYLPATEEESVSYQATPAERPTLRGTETILVAEDSEQVRKLIRGVLRLGGYSVIEASNAGEALLMCERHPGPIDLLLTDVVMPHMGGGELAERLAPVRPDMRVLYMSGYADNESLYRRAAMGQAAVISKPLAPDDLLRKVRDVLNPEKTAT